MHSSYHITDVLMVHQTWIIQLNMIGPNQVNNEVNDKYHVDDHEVVDEQMQIIALLFQVDEVRLCVPIELALAVHLYL